MSALPQLNPDETAPRMRIVPRLDANRASPDVNGIPQKGAEQITPGKFHSKDIPANGVEGSYSIYQASVRSIYLKQMEGVSVEDIPTRRLPAIENIPTRRLPAIENIPTRHLSVVVVGDETKEDIATQRLSAIAVQDETKQKQKKRLVGFVVRAIVTVLLFAFLLKSMDWSTLLATLTHVRHTYLLMGLSAGVLCVVFSAYGWRSVVLAESIRADLARLIDLYLMGIGFSHFLPTSMGGDAVKAFYMGRDSNNMAGAASAVLVSRITSFVGMLLIALPGLVIFHKYFTSQIIIEFLLLSLLLIGAIIGAMLTATLLPKLSKRFLKGKWVNNSLVMKFLKVGEAVSATIKKPRSMLAATVFGMMFWIASFLNYFGYATALGVHVPLPFYVVAIPFVSIIASLPISINGFGVRESAFVYLFSTVHVATSTATLLALLMDTQVLLFGLIGGCIYFAMNKEKK